jgi:hypothetical protein
LVRNGAKKDKRQGGTMLRFAVITGLAAGSWLLVGAAVAGMMNFLH